MLQDQISLSDFVQQEAREKCFEIEVKAFKQFEKEKKAIFEREQALIQEEFEMKIRRKEQEEKIKHSALVNRSRLHKMQARNKALMKVFSDVQFHVYQQIISDETFYKKLLQRLVVQGLIKLFEPVVRIRCLERDVDLINQIIAPAKLEFQNIVKSELEVDFDCDISIDEDKMLTLRDLEDNSKKGVQDYSEDKGKNEVIKKTEDDIKCFGGVLLTNSTGLVICKNTLDVRTDICFQDSLPDIRRILFQ